MIIVDDESWVREGITHIVDWPSLGIEILASLSDGIEALEFVRTADRKPDICLTDIRMPGMDGFELLNKIRDIAPDCRGVILSGYRDFEYAREAIHQGVFEYVLKPMGKDEITSVVRRLTDELASQHIDLSRTEAEEATPSLLVNRAIRYIESHITEPIGLVEVAEALSVSSAYLSSVFSETKEETFKHFFTRKKMQAAKEIWRREPHLRVYELCLRVGYRDTNYFAKIFKQTEGVTPREFKIGAEPTSELHQDCSNDRPCDSRPS